MKPDAQDAYDALPQILASINIVAGHLDQLPLDQALAAVDRTAAAGCYNPPQGDREVVTPDLAARRRQLVEFAIAFRDAVGILLTEPL